MAAGGGSLLCAPVMCYDVYGAARPWFNATSRLCAPAPPSGTPTPSGSAGATPTRTPNPSGTRSALPSGTLWPTPSPSAPPPAGALVCVHGSLSCGASLCVCACDEGWAALPPDGSPFTAVQCNTTAGGETAGQRAAVACANPAECFFVDRLPYALVCENCCTLHMHSPAHAVCTKTNNVFDLL